MFAPSGGLTYGVTRLKGNYTFMFSIKNPVLPCNVIGPVAIVEFHGTKYLQISQGTDVVTCPLAWTGIGWVTLMVKRDGNSIVFGENGVIKGMYLDTVGNIHQNIEIMDGQEGEIFNLYAFDSAISDKAYAYYYADLTENHGDALCPLW